MFWGVVAPYVIGIGLQGTLILGTALAAEDFIDPTGQQPDDKVGLNRFIYLSDLAQSVASGCALVVSGLLVRHVSHGDAAILIVASVLGVLGLFTWIKKKSPNQYEAWTRLRLTPLNLVVVSGNALLAIIAVILAYT